MGNPQSEEVLTRDFVSLFASGFLFLGSFFLLVPVLPQYLEQEAGATTTQVGLLMGTITVASFLLRPIVGRRTDRHGRKPLMVLGAAVFTFVSPLYTITASMAVLPFLLFLQGVSIACVHTASLIFVGDIAPAVHRGKSMSWFQASFNLGIMLAPPLGELIKNNLGYRAVFMTASVVAGASLLTLLNVSEKKISEVEEVKGSSRTLSERNVIILVSVAVFSGTVGIGTMEAFLPLFAEEKNISNFALFFTIFAGLLIALRLITGWVPDRFGRKRSVVFSLLILAASMVMLSITDNFIMLCLSAIVFGVGFAYHSPALSALLVDRTPAQGLGRAFGIYTAAFEGGIAFGATMLGPVISSFGYSWAFRIIGLINLTGALFFAAGYKYLSGDAGA